MDEEGVSWLRERLRHVRDPLTLLAGLFAHAPVGFQIYTADGHSLLVNDAFRDIFGSEPPPGYNVLEDEIAAAQGVLPLIRRSFAGETVQVPTTWYDPRELKQVVVPEGRRVAINATFFPIFDEAGQVSHVAITFKDVTREVERQELLEAIIQQSGDGIIVADAAGVLRLLNPAAAAQHGVPAREASAQEWASTYGLRSLDGAPLALEATPLYRALHGESVKEARWKVRRPDGSERVLVGTATPLRHADGSSAGAVVTTRDETDRIGIETELQRTAEERTRIMSVLGHDLRNPLSAINMASAMLMRGDLAPKQAELVSQMARSADRMARMISDLLDFTRVRDGSGLPLQRRERVALRALCQEVVAELSVAYPDRTITLDARGDGVGEFDPDRLAQVVSNLVGNALQHGRPGSPVRVTLDETSADLTISVENTGKPIPTSALGYIFEPFRRGDEAAEGGLGLGLFIVQQLVGAHGGAIEVDSGDAGTRFTVTLPRHFGD